MDIINGDVVTYTWMHRFLLNVTMMHIKTEHRNPNERQMKNQAKSYVAK